MVTYKVTIDFVAKKNAIKPKKNIDVYECVISKLQGVIKD